MRRITIQALIFVSLGALLASFSTAAEPDREGIEFFEKHVRPVFVEHCSECHASQKTKGGLRLDSRAGWTTGGDSGPAIVPGKPDESLLIQAVRYGGDYEMPPKGKLPAAIIRDLEQWVARGAPDPRGEVAVKKPLVGLSLEAGRQHWSYRPVQPRPLPTVRKVEWPRTAIDRFVLVKLEEHGLSPAVEADRVVLARRLYFDLLGLPPTPAEIDEFLADNSPTAYERLVERLLASPRFGERWGRHWLDVARYAESLTLRGFIFKEAWRYRDYVIDTLNADRPFDEFVREQIAGDLMPSESLSDKQRRLIATTYLALGNTNLEEQDKKQLEMDYIDEQLDAISKGLLAQTVTCARCHDHKFDPIPQRDYYALAGIFRNTRALEHSNVSKWVEVPLPDEPAREALFRQQTEALAAVQSKIKDLKEVVKLAAKKADGKSAPLVLAAGQLPGIVVDETQAKRVGDWKTSQFTKRYIGEGYVHDLNTSKGQKTLTFVPELPRDGLYEVRFAYSPDDSRSAAVPVTVFGADGEKTITINEQDPPPIDGRFVSLGQFRFEKAGQSFVIVANDDTQGYVTADAVQFVPVDGDVATAAQRDRIAPLQPPLDLTAAEAELKNLEAEMKQLAASAALRPMAMSVIEQEKIEDGRINIRGVVHNLGEPVPRGFLQVATIGTPPRLPANQSGRLQLADWMTHPANPLTARVFANRAWHWLFGAGLVRTVDNFGTTGEPPSHPELLDYLADRFTHDGWSVKELVRTIVCSAAYRQSSSNSPPTVAADPENRLVARTNRRRLDAEALRDAILVVNGELCSEMGGRTFKAELAADYGFVHADSRRSVYAPIFRNSLPEIFQVFDFADPSLVTGRRDVSTVAPQALFLMNHSFVIEQSRLAAKRMLEQPAGDAPAKMTFAFRSAVGRPPTPRELSAVQSFLAPLGDSPTSDEALNAWQQVFQALFASLDFRYVD